MPGERARLRALRLLWLICLLSAALTTGVLAHDPTKPLPNLAGPFTIKGQVLDPHGRPLAGYAVRLIPILPEQGADTDNSFYQIPNRDEHHTVTDASGRFVMTNVVHYPQVTSRMYKIFPGSFDQRQKFPYIHIYKSDIVNLPAATSTTVEMVIKTEPAAIVQVTLRDRAGRPFTGSRAFTVVTGHGRRSTVTGEFKDGVAQLYLAPGDVQNPGRIVLLEWENAAEARRQARAHGQQASPGRSLVLFGIQGQRNLMLVPGQKISVEFTLD